MRIFRRKKPGFLTRLSNIIIIQVLFVFAALAMVIFYPDDDHSVDSEYVYMRERFKQAADKLSGLAQEASAANKPGLGEQMIRGQLARSLDIDNVVQCYVYRLDENGAPDHFFTLRSQQQLSELYGLSSGFDDLVDHSIVKQYIHLAEDQVIPIIYGSRYFVYYYRFVPDNSEPMVVAAISDHKASSLGLHHIRYPFLILFLVSGLVSLLTVHLINKRFQEPLERLIRGFKKTVRGELYCLVETDMDDELSELSQAYNNMSLTLWENHREVSDYNAKLEAANELLAESQEFLGTLIDSSPTCIISTSPDGEIMLFNRKASEVFGTERSKMIGRNIDELFTHRLKDIRNSKAIVGDSHAMEILCRRGDGNLFPAYLITAPVNTADGEVWANLYLVKDISESKNFQEMMVRLDRYYTRGEMAGDIAHEINNFLAIISGNLELMPLLMKKHDPDRIAAKLEVMKSAVDRITRFTDGLMDSHEDDASFEVADINQLVETVIAFLKPQNRLDRMKIITKLSTDIPLVELDSSQIQQLLVNLIYNASDALEDSSGERRIVIETSRSGDPASGEITLTVRDNGPGVQPDKEKLLFVKRFTTKPRGHGIGLITCKRIVDTHGGAISYAYDGGAVFSVALTEKRRAEESAESPDMMQTSEVPAV